MQTAQLTAPNLLDMEVTDKVTPAAIRRIGILHVVTTKIHITLKQELRPPVLILIRNSEPFHIIRHHARTILTAMHGTSTILTAVATGFTLWRV